ncbi:hypothetical protein J3458_021521 [Metarhizium acridum]|uniref:uncharacterized protein n=1 Tax=Metarhizium acridum TaxID=92637 RepID=UPI001C6D230B|nr:hypothetical protein J3458_021437 [Metarhizium acridum]KAG8406194.1 hypothetical protein J3458_021521 [Metarhizium acridum]
MAFLDTVCRDGANSDFPCANQLLECIIRIKQVRLLGQRVMADGPGPVWMRRVRRYSTASHHLMLQAGLSWLLELGSSSESSPPSLSPELQDARPNGPAGLVVPHATIQADLGTGHGS